MKREKLRFPYRWEERRPHLEGQVLFVPDYYDKHETWEGRFAPFFDQDRPQVMEYCAGNGDWIVEKASNHLDINWIAVEWRFDRVRKIWSKMRNRGLSNLLIVCGEAQTFTRHYVPSNSMGALYVNFPDPWPKGRHAKNRLFQPPFVQEMGRVLQAGGSLISVTDDAAYSEQISSQVRGSKLFLPVFDPPYYKTEWPDYGDSFFDALWRSKGREIRYFRFTKVL